MTAIMYTDIMPVKVDLLAQISELQEAVSSMKSSLKEAVSRLGAVAATEGEPREDQLISSSMEGSGAMEVLQRQSQELQTLQEKCDANTAEVLKLVLALKGDVTSLKKDVSLITEKQDALQMTVDSLLEDRRHDTLTRSRIGSIGDALVGGAGGGRGSGAHSNDSGVALLLERAHQAFHGDRFSSTSPAASTMHRTSDQDSLPDQPSLLVPPLVYDYVAGLSSNPHSTPQPGLSMGPNDHDDLAYDSDSSLTLAANKSISLSTTISKEMRANMAAVSHTYAHVHDAQDTRGHLVTTTKSGLSSNKCSVSNNSSTDSGGGPMIIRTDSDGSDQSRDVVQPGRRRRYEKGSSSSTSKLYGPLSRSVSQDSATYQALSAFGPVLGHGLYSHTSHQHRLHRDSRDTHRCRVARELLETEKKYCRTLWIIQDTFAEPLKKCGILSQKDINTLFPCEVYQLYDKHCHLQHQLRERLASWQWQPLVGDILAKFTDSHHSDVLRLYTNYVNDFPVMLKTFHKLCATSDPFADFLKSCLEQPSCGGLDLGAFLLTPVQRIPRYILLLKKLIKVTDESHPDFHHVNVCLDRLKDFLDRLNDSIHHSIQLVHAGIPREQPHMMVNARHTRGRVSRSPRRTRSTLESPTYSPERPTSQSADRGSSTPRSDQCSSNGRSVASPKRSISIAGGGPAKALVVSKRRPQSSDGGRSRSLPRTAPLSPVNSQDGSAESSVGSGRPARPLPTARSVADMTGSHEDDEEVEQSWEELATSEQSLLDAQQKKHHTSKQSLLQQTLQQQSDVGQAMEANILSGGGGLSSAQSNGNLAQEAQRPLTWQDGQIEAAHDEGTAKKKSIKTSLKNMFTFKKRNAASPSGPRPAQHTSSHHHHYHHPHDHHHHHHHTAHHHPPRPATARGMREESDYWDPQTQSHDPSLQATILQQATSASHQQVLLQSQQAQILTQSQQAQALSQPQQNQILTQAQPQSSTTAISSQAPPTHPQSSAHSQTSSSHYQTLASLPPHCSSQPPLMIPPQPPSTPVPGMQPPLSIVGDFVDEDGNPCSNV